MLRPRERDPPLRALPRLRVLSQDPETSAAVGRFCAVLILGLWPVTLTLAVQKWLQVRNVTPVALTSLAVAVVNAALNAILIRVARLGLVGSALATSLSRAVNLVLLVEYVRRTPTEWDAVVDPEGGDARAASRNPSISRRRRRRRRRQRARPDAVARMTRLGARGAVMVAAEASSFDVTVVFASQLGQVALGRTWRCSTSAAWRSWPGRWRLASPPTFAWGIFSARAPRSRARRRGRQHRVRRRVDGGVRAAHRRVSPPGVGEIFVGSDDSGVALTRRRHRPRRRRVPNFRRRARRDVTAFCARAAGRRRSRG